MVWDACGGCGEWSEAGRELSLAFAIGKPFSVGLSWLCLASTWWCLLSLPLVTVPGCCVLLLLVHFTMVLEKW